MYRSIRSEGGTPGNNLLRSLAAAVLQVARTVAWWRRVALQRRALSAMDERLLADIGLSRGEALREARRPFWDVPPREELSQPAPALNRRARGAPRPRVAGRTPRWA